MAKSNDFSKKSHPRIIWELKGDDLSGYYNAPFDYDTAHSHMFPSMGPCDYTSDAWKNVGVEISSIAGELKKARDDLFDSDKGWKGEAAKAFKQKVNLVYLFSRRLAYMCDTENQEAPPTDLDIGTGDAFENPPEDYSINVGHRKVWSAVADDVNAQRLNCKTPPWLGTDKRYELSVGLNECSDECYAFFRNGEQVSVPDGGDWVDSDDMHQKYSDSGIQTRPYEGSDEERKVPKTWKDETKLYIDFKFNKDEHEGSREAGNKLSDAYDEAKGKLPKAPPELKLKVAGEDGGAGGGGGPGGGGPGSGPGGPGGPGSFPDPSGPGGPGSPDGPDPDVPDPDHPDPDGPDPDGPDPDHPDPDGPDPDGPDPDRPDPDRPDPDGPDPDGPDGPDTPNPTPDERSPGPDDPMDPVHVPDEKWDPNDPQDDSDLGGETDLSRTGGGSGGMTGGPGGGGPGGGPGTGVSAGSGPGGGAGGGLGGGAGGQAGGLGSGGAGGARGGGMGGMGMMPMMGGAGGAGAGGAGGDADRDTWLDEDEDVWGDDDDAPPPVIGGAF